MDKYAQHLFLTLQTKIASITSQQSADGIGSTAGPSLGDMLGNDWQYAGEGMHVQFVQQ